MSGICGVIAWDGNPSAAHRLDSMIAATPHRGTSGHQWIRDGVAVSAQDRPGSSAAQLATDEPSGYVVCLDGRLDNRRELTSRLQGDLAAAPATDAELVLAAVRRWGTGAAARLIGDFAFIAWNHRSRRVLAARDLMGMRTLHLRPEPGGIVFATEVAALLADMGTAPEIDERTIAGYLLGERTVDRHTAYVGIEQLLPGGWMTMSDAGASATGSWSLRTPQPIGRGTESDYAERFAQLFEEAVASRIEPYSKVGIMLSGGLDSGAVAASAGKARTHGRLDSQTDITTLSWAFDELTECDERRTSRHIVEHYSLSPIDVPADDAWPLRDYPAHGPDDAWPRVEVFQPLVDRTLAAAAAAGAQTVLTGDRGDEVVGSWVFDHLGMLTGRAWRALQADVAAEEEASGSSALRAAGRLLVRPSLRSKPPSAAAPPWIPPRLATYNEPAARTGRLGTAELRRERILAPFTSARAAQLNLRFARRGADYADPWSDQRLAEFVLAAPGHFVNRIAEPKRLAREAMRGIIPEPARVRARKVEPHALYDRGFRERERSTLLDLTTNMRAAAHGWIDEAALQREVAMYLDGGEPAHDWWRPLSVEMWLRAHFPQIGGTS